jgi:hypothetical protein
MQAPVGQWSAEVFMRTDRAVRRWKAADSYRHRSDVGGPSAPISLNHTSRAAPPGTHTDSGRPPVVRRLHGRPRSTPTGLRRQDQRPQHALDRMRQPLHEGDRHPPDKGQGHLCHIPAATVPAHRTVGGSLGQRSGRSWCGRNRSSGRVARRRRYRSADATALQSLVPWSGDRDVLESDLPGSVRSRLRRNAGNAPKAAKGRHPARAHGSMRRMRTREAW